MGPSSSATSRNTRAWAMAAAALVAGGSLFAQQPAMLDASAIRAAVENALAVTPRGYQGLGSPQQAGVRVLRVDVESTVPSSHRITIDLSQRALSYDPRGDVEAVLDHLIASTAALTGTARSTVALPGYSRTLVMRPPSWAKACVANATATTAQQVRIFIGVASLVSL